MSLCDPMTSFDAVGVFAWAAYSDGRDKEPPPRPPPPPRTEPAADDWTCGKCKEFCSPSFFFCPSCGAAGA